MRKSTWPVLLAALVFLAACGGDSPEAKAKSIEQLLSRKLPMNEKQIIELNQALGEAKQLLASGKKEEAGRAYDKALTILRRAEDAALYNKASQD